MDKQSKLPALQFYTGDWRKDPGVQALDYFERGVWFEILCIMHESEQRGRLVLNGKKMPEAALARLLGLDNQTVNQVLTKLFEYGVAKAEPDTGIIFNKRMVEDERIRQIRREAGKLGGNPALLNQSDNQKPTTRDNQNPTPSVSSSVSSSKKKTSAPDGAFDRFWLAYPRKKSKGDALKAWNKIRPDEQLQDRIHFALERAKTSEDWKKDSGKWVPYPASWLNAMGWEDDVGEPQRDNVFEGAI